MDCQIVIQKVCPSLSSRQCAIMSVTLQPWCHQTISFEDLTNEKWYLLFLLICISHLE